MLSVTSISPNTVGIMLDVAITLKVISVGWAKFPHTNWLLFVPPILILESVPSSIVNVASLGAPDGLATVENNLSSIVSSTPIYPTIVGESNELSYLIQMLSGCLSLRIEQEVTFVTLEIMQLEPKNNKNFFKSFLIYILVIILFFFGTIFIFYPHKIKLKNSLLKVVLLLSSDYSRTNEIKPSIFLFNSKTQL